MIKWLICFTFLATIQSTSAQLLDDEQKAADQGDAKAQYIVGCEYDEGITIPRDEAKAMLWFTKAADQGNVDAQKALGLVYEGGHVVPKDRMKELEWHTKAVRQGNVEAEDEKGQGVPPDAAEAQKWYAKAASPKNPPPLKPESRP